MYLSPNSEDSWSIRPWHENPDNARHETADLAACAFQSVLKLQLVEASKALSDSTAERVDLPTGFLRIAIADLENNPFSFPIR